MSSAILVKCNALQFVNNSWKLVYSLDVKCRYPFNLKNFLAKKLKILISSVTSLTALLSEIQHLQKSQNFFAWLFQYSVMISVHFHGIFVEKKRKRLFNFSTNSQNLKTLKNYWVSIENSELIQSIIILPKITIFLTYIVQTVTLCQNWVTNQIWRIL